MPPAIAVGEASQGALSLFLAIEAATRFCSRYPTPGPLGRRRLAAPRDLAQLDTVALRQRLDGLSERLRDRTRFQLADHQTDLELERADARSALAADMASFRNISIDEAFITVSPVVAGRDEEPRLGMVAGAELLPARGVWSRLLSARRLSSIRSPTGISLAHPTGGARWPSARPSRAA